MKLDEWKKILNYENPNEQGPEIVGDERKCAYTDPLTELISLAIKDIRRAWNEKDC